MPPSAFSMLLGFDKDALLAEFMQNDELVYAGEYSDSSSGSDSDPSDDNMESSELKFILPGKNVTIKKKGNRKKSLKSSTSAKSFSRRRSLPDKRILVPPRKLSDCNTI